MLCSVGLADKTEPRAARAAYRARGDALRIELTNGAVITIPVKLIPDLKHVAPSDVQSVEVLGRGRGGIGKPWTRISVSLPWSCRCLQDLNGWPNWLASEAGGHRRPKQPQREGTGRKAVARGFGERGLLRASLLTESSGQESNLANADLAEAMA